MKIDLGGCTWEALRFFCRRIPHLVLRFQKYVLFNHEFEGQHLDIQQQLVRRRYHLSLADLRARTELLRQ